MGTKIYFKLIAVVCGLAVSLCASCQMREPDAAPTYSFESNNRDLIRKKIKILTTERSWTKSGTPKRNALMEAIILAIDCGVIYDGMPNDEFRSVIEVDSAETSINGQTFNYIPLNYTEETMPDALTNAAMGTQWYIIYIKKADSVTGFKLRYGSPKIWRADE